MSRPVATLRGDHRLRADALHGPDAAGRHGHTQLLQGRDSLQGGDLLPHHAQAEGVTGECG